MLGRAVGLALLVVAGLGAGPVGAAPHPPAPKVTVRAAPPSPGGPGLKITVDDGRPSLRPGDTARWTIVVSNTGTTDVPRLDITQIVPAGVVDVNAHPGAALRNGTLHWSQGIRAGRSTTITFSGRLDRLPPGQQRLAAVACATTTSAQRPTVCAADSDALPVLRAAAAGATRAAGHGIGWWPAAVTGGVAIAAAAGGVAWMRRRRGPLPPPTPAA